MKELKFFENVIVFIKGFEKLNEIIVFFVYYDYVGEYDGEIYNGVDDDGSGIVLMLEIV